MTPPVVKRALLAACLAGVGLATGAETLHDDKHAARHAKKTTAAHTQAQAHKSAHASAHATAHKPPAKAAHPAPHAKTHTAAKKTAAHKPAHKPAHELAHEHAHKSAHDVAVKAAHPSARVATLAARPLPVAVPPAARVLPKPAASNADPNGDGFLNLYVELCVKRIGEIDAFRDKLLREKVPRLQPDSAKAFLSGMEGDAWPVPYQGKMGNFVLVLPAQKNLCMLYARRTDTAAVEQGFDAMVAKAPEPMIATRGPQTRAGPRAPGETRTASTSWAPPGSGRRMQFILTTNSSPDAQVQAFGSVAIVVGPEPGPGPDKASSAVTRSPNGSPAPAPRPRAQP
jgi:hypothetical protein